MDLAARLQHFQLQHFAETERGKAIDTFYLPRFLETTVLCTQTTVDNSEKL